MKRILVNATQREEIRVAIVDGQKLYNLDIEATTDRQKKGNIYKGVVSSTAPSLDAVFVDYGGARQGFLPIKEIHRQYRSFSKASMRTRGRRPPIREKQELIVQITREERSHKGASLSTYISLTGQYLVLLPDSSRTNGISQRIAGTERKRMLELCRRLPTNKNEGVILRTASLNSSVEDLQKNLDYLRRLWKQIQNNFNERQGPFLIYKEANIVIQAIQNNLDGEVDEIIIDNPDIYEETREFITMVLPHYRKRLKLYTGDTPLFNRMQIEEQIESLYQHKVNLPSGGSIVVDHTEALTTIDINSARSTQQQDLEKTALETNLEAIDEIARQLRLRDLGGLLVIDFIDMLSRANKRKVENYLQDLLQKDRARTRLGSISKFGLLEMSRQRLRPSLRDGSEILCPRCSGRGFIRTVESCAFVVFRLIEEEAVKVQTVYVVAQVPAEVHQFLIKKRSDELKAIEQQHAVKVAIITNPQIQTPHYKILIHQKKDSAARGKEQHKVVSVRSSYHEDTVPTESRKRKMESRKIKKESRGEMPAILTVADMRKTSWYENCKNLWHKLCGWLDLRNIFSKYNDRTTRQSKNYVHRRFKGGRPPRRRYKHKSRRFSHDSEHKSADSRRESDFPRRTNAGSRRSSDSRTDFKDADRIARSKRRGTPHRAERKYSQKSQSVQPPSTQSERGDEPRSQTSLPLSDKGVQPSTSPRQSSKNMPTRFRPRRSRFGTSKTKFIQVETKGNRKTDTNR